MSGKKHFHFRLRSNEQQCQMITIGLVMTQAYQPDVKNAYQNLKRETPAKVFIRAQAEQEGKGEQDAEE